jgi:aryl-alcohol dehydrogenase (NADP+)
MDYMRLGSSGLEVSRICLGCMSYGDPARGGQSWSLDEAASRPLFKQALDSGVTFFDTANVYSAGSSEEITGRALLSLTRREEVVIATKVQQWMGPGPNGQGLSRGAILTQVDASLRRLGTDYIDLYIMHRPDPETPWEETLEALHDVVRAGKVRYLGASVMYAWEFTKALYLADLHGWTRFVSMQNHYNLLYREEEREMLPLCRDQGAGVTPFSPLARGLLTRPWDEATARSGSDETLRGRYGESDRPIVDAVHTVARRRGVAPAHIALAWLLSRPGVSAAIVGATKAHHLNDAVAALEVELSDADVAELSAPYQPHDVTGHVAGR